MKCYSYIRFSTKEQQSGKSLERQVENARKFAQKMNWEMDESLCMYDLGLSGFHATHKERGELGVFLQAVKEKKIQTPSALLVESFDRLSRQTVLKAFNQLCEIISAGITVVTLMDEQVYTEESIESNFNQILISVSIMFRAHEESKTKQVRRTYTWDKSKKEARNGKKIQARHAAWLKLDPVNNKFVEIKEHAESVRKIYDLYIQGHGISAICKALNTEKRKTFTENKNGWSNSTVNRLLTTRAVLGEIQFMKTSEIKNGKREMIKDGEVLKDYYPAIISENTFYAAQEVRKSKGGQFGKVGEMKNLFSLKARCGYCGSSMSYTSRGRKRFPYLSCNSAKKGFCEINQMFSIRYDHLEERFLNTCKRLDLKNIISDEQSIIQSKIKNLKIEIVTIDGKIKESEQAVQNFTDGMRTATPDTLNILVENINKENAEQAELKKQRETVQAELLSQENLHGSTEQNLETLKTVIDQMNSIDDSTRLEVRRKLQKSIRLLVDEIKIYPVGTGYSTLMEDEVFAKRYEITKMGIANHSRFFSRFREVQISFNGGGQLRLIHDSDTDGLKLSFETDKNDMLTAETINDMKKNPNITPELLEIVQGSKIKL